MFAPLTPPTAEAPSTPSPGSPIALAPQPVPSSATTPAPPLAVELPPAPTVSLRQYLDQRVRLNNEGSTMARKADSPLGGSVRFARRLFGDKPATLDPEREHKPPSSTDGS